MFCLGDTKGVRAIARKTSNWDSSKIGLGVLEQIMHWVGIERILFAFHVPTVILIIRAVPLIFEYAQYNDLPETEKHLAVLTPGFYQPLCTDFAFSCGDL